MANSLAVEAAAVAPRVRTSSYPEPFRLRMNGRTKRVLGDLFGVTSFGVNLTTLQPGGESSILHRHMRQDEFVFVVEGRATLVTDRVELGPGECAGFPAGGVAHQLVNRTHSPVSFLEIGDRAPGDAGVYPNDDLVATLSPEGRWLYHHKDGRPYE